VNIVPLAVRNFKAYSEVADPKGFCFYKDKKNENSYLILSMKPLSLEVAVNTICMKHHEIRD
jgi:hypothetical protein